MLAVVTMDANCWLYFKVFVCIKSESTELRFGLVGLDVTMKLGWPRTFGRDGLVLVLRRVVVSQIKSLRYYLKYDN